ncbi:MAG TPA: asparagine synthase-related protein [Vicinamibacterales bacterium]|nr:asparagine synthase-related protein [Vicinamibacterales bacterium]
MFIAYVSTDPGLVSRIADQWRGEDEACGWTLWSDVHIVVRASTQYAHVAEGALPAWGYARLEEPAAAANDLAAVSSHVYSNGYKAIAQLSGTYGVALWDRNAQLLTACRDAVGIAALYYRRDGAGVYVSDTLDTFDRGEVDREYVAAFIADGHQDLDRTIWKDCLAVPAGSALVWNNGHVAIETLWSPEHFTPARTGDIRENARSFRALAAKALSFHVEAGEMTWADLSGGLDSSTVVALAALNARREPAKALGGTITLFGSLGDEDERQFSNAVARRYSIRNLQVNRSWPWRDDGQPAPITPHPTRDFPFYARDRQIAALLRANGAGSLLSGVGPDNYLPRTTLHIPDLLLTGRIREGLDQLWECALASRRRVWELAVNDVLRPALPIQLQALLARGRLTIPDWVKSNFAQANHYETHMLRKHLLFGRRGSICQSLVAQRFKELSTSLQGWHPFESVSIRHPLLFLPLVEFCLQLPHRHRTSLLRFKPVLRVAMADALPALVLNRETKAGSLLRRYVSAISQEHPLIECLLASPILADLGAIEPAKLLAAADRARAGKHESLRRLCLTLSLETWLSVRFGRYDHCLTSTRRRSHEKTPAIA